MYPTSHHNAGQLPRQHITESTYPLIWLPHPSYPFDAVTVTPATGTTTLVVRITRSPHAFRKSAPLGIGCASATPPGSGQRPHRVLASLQTMLPCTAVLAHLRRPTFETTWVTVTSWAEAGAKVEKRRMRTVDWLRRCIEAVLTVFVAMKLFLCKTSLVVAASWHQMLE